MKDPALRSNIDAIAKMRATPSFLLNQAARILRDCVQEALRPSGLSLQQMTVLRLLANCGPINQQLLGAACHLDKTTVTELIDSLERAGLAQRAVSESDRRSREVSITTNGKKTLTRLSRLIDRAEQEFLACFSEREWKTIRRCLTRYLDRLDNATDNGG